MTWEDINELETRVTLYRSEDGAKSAMEKDIHELASCKAFEGEEPKRKDALHVSLADRFEWAIEKVLRLGTATPMDVQSVSFAAATSQIELSDSVFDAWK